MTCAVCNQGVVSRKCGKCGSLACANCARTAIAGVLYCNRCFGVAVTGGDAGVKSALLVDESWPNAQTEHPEWFVAEPEGVGPAKINGTPKPTLASIALNLDKVKVADIRAEITAHQGILASLKVLLRVAEAREKKRRPKKKVQHETA